jgi:hypothetical protein
VTTSILAAGASVRPRDPIIHGLNYRCSRRACRRVRWKYSWLGGADAFWEHCCPNWKHSVRGMADAFRVRERLRAKQENK